MAVNYKFKGAKDFDSVSIDGNFITVGDLKDKIFESKQLGRGKDYDLVVMNAETNEEYLDEATLIPKNSSVLICPLPGAPDMPIVTVPVINQEEQAVENRSERLLKTKFLGAGKSVTNHGGDSINIKEPEQAGKDVQHQKVTVEPAEKKKKKLPANVSEVRQISPREFAGQDYMLPADPVMRREEIEIRKHESDLRGLFNKAQRSLQLAKKRESRREVGNNGDVSSVSLKSISNSPPTPLTVRHQQSPERHLGERKQQSSRLLPPGSSSKRISPRHGRDDSKNELDTSSHRKRHRPESSALISPSAPTTMEKPGSEDDQYQKVKQSVLGGVKFAGDEGEEEAVADSRKQKVKSSSTSAGNGASAAGIGGKDKAEEQIVNDYESSDD